MNEVNCTIVGTCVADILVRPVPLSSPFEAGRIAWEGRVEYEVAYMLRICH